MSSNRPQPRDSPSKPLEGSTRASVQTDREFQLLNLARLAGLSPKQVFPPPKNSYGHGPSFIDRLPREEAQPDVRLLEHRKQATSGLTNSENSLEDMPLSTKERHLPVSILAFPSVQCHWKFTDPMTVI